MKTMLTRRLWILSSIAFLSCESPGQPEVLPMTIGNWKRMAVENIPAEEIPEEYKRLAPKRARRAHYSNGTRVVATLYEFGVQAVAFEQQQKWRPQAKKMVFHQGPYFGILETEQDDIQPLKDLADLLDKSLKR